MTSKDPVNVVLVHGVFVDAAETTSTSFRSSPTGARVSLLPPTEKEMTGKHGSQMMARIRMGLLVVTALVYAEGVGQATSLVLNGSFESGPFAGSFVNLPGGTTTISDWIVTGEGIDYIGTLWQPSDGTHSLDLDGSVGSSTTPPFVHGGIAQTFATTPGTDYSVTFDMAGNPFALPLIKPMRVLAAGDFMDFTFDITGHNAGNMGWLSNSWTFTATDALTTLEFLSLTGMPGVPTGFGPTLDNVSVTPLTNPVPEPATLLLFGTGLVAAGVRRYRQRHR